MYNFRKNVKKMHSLGGRCFGKQVYPQATRLFFLMTAIASVYGLAYEKFKYLYLVPKGLCTLYQKALYACVCVCGVEITRYLGLCSRLGLSKSKDRDT